MSHVIVHGSGCGIAQEEVPGCTCDLVAVPREQVERTLRVLEDTGKDVAQALELLAAMLNEDGNGGINWISRPLKGTVGWEIHQLAEKYRYGNKDLAASIADLREALGKGEREAKGD